MILLTSIGIYISQKKKKDINYNNHQKIITWQLDKISKMPSLQLFIGNIFFLRSVDIQLPQQQKI